MLPPLLPLLPLLLLLVGVSVPNRLGWLSCIDRTHMPNMIARHTCWNIRCLSADGRHTPTIHPLLLLGPQPTARLLLCKLHGFVTT